MFDTPGHCVGHQSLGVDLDETGTVVVCGDAVYCKDNFDRDTWDSQSEPATARESALRLRSIAEARDAFMIYGHDPAQFHELRLAPDASYR